MAAKTIEIEGVVENGKLDLHRSSFALQLKTLSGPVKVTVEELRETITDKQRRYFFGVVVSSLVAAFKELGHDHTKADVLEFLKERFLFREKINKVSNAYVKVPISLSKKDDALTKPEFEAFKFDIQRWAAEILNVQIPEPNEMSYAE